VTFVAPRKIEYKSFPGWPGMWVCQICGAMVADRDIHDDYHNTGR
jgi:hypothetical protein